VLTGAGVSTASLIPDYRDAEGNWKRPAPVQYRDFVTSSAIRQRYWARSLLGWPWFQQARPNPNHRALAALEVGGWVRQLVTQNVDRLHQGAGSKKVVDLHGRLDIVRCLACGERTPRDPLQRQLKEKNPSFAERAAEMAPDGDAYVEGADFSGFQIPSCASCGGMLKPDVVFFGEGVPKERVEASREALLSSDGLLVLGSSLMVYSGFRFCRLAAERQIPMAAINLGRTRADDLFDFKLEASCESVLPRLAELLTG
jgi:NAD-dependent SIR2 family protein deacetylase